MLDLSICRGCGSKNIRWDKRFQCGTGTGWTYHFHCHCMDCHFGYNVAHDHPYPKKITENYEWTISKTTKKHILKMLADHILPEFNLPFPFDLDRLLQNSINYKNNSLRLF